MRVRATCRRSGSSPSPAHQPGDRAQRRRLARAVRAEERDDLALLDRERDAVQRADLRRSAPRRPCSSSSGIGGSQVRLDHGGVAPHLFGRALGDLLAEVEDVHAVGDRHHEVDVVLDEQDGQVEVRRGRARISRRRAPRPPRGSARRRARRGAAAAASPRARARARSASASRTAGPRRAGRRGARAPRYASASSALALRAAARRKYHVRACVADEHVVEHGHAAGRATTFWKVRAIPAPAILCAGVRSRSLAVEADAAGVRLVEPGDHVEGVVLPAPFGPISPAICPGRRRARRSSSATTPPKPQGDVLDRQERRHRRDSTAVLRVLSSHPAWRAYSRNPRRREAL